LNVLSSGRDIISGVRIGIAVAAAALALRAAPAAAVDTAVPEPNPLARDYVDIGLHGGVAWCGNVARANLRRHQATVFAANIPGRRQGAFAG
jgi:hypothetical protein